MVVTRGSEPDSGFRRLTGISIRGFRSILEAEPKQTPLRPQPAHPAPGEFMDWIISRQQDAEAQLRAAVPLAPLTVIVGPNGAGKSNILGAIRLCSSLSTKLLGQQVTEEHYVPTFDEAEEWPGSIAFGELDPSAIDLLEFSRLQREKDLRVRLTFESTRSATSVISSGGSMERSLSNDWSSLIFECSPEAQKPEIQCLAELYHMEGDATGAIRIASEIEYLSPDRVAQSGVAEPEIVATLTALGQDKTWSTELVKMGERLFETNWRPLLRSPERMQFGDNTLGERAVSLPIRAGSLGTRQFFPIAVMLAKMAMNRGGILLVEEPEISLHPQAQVDVGEYFAKFAQARVQVIFTTHSHYLLLGIAKAVREKVLSSQDVCVLDCKKTRRGTRIEQLPMDPYGRIDGWIPSFAKVDEYIFQHWVDSLPEDN